jgi:hypothetical protein
MLPAGRSASCLVLLFLVASGVILGDHLPARAQEGPPETLILSGPLNGSIVNVGSVTFRAIPDPVPGSQVTCTLRGSSIVEGPTDCTSQFKTYQTAALPDGTYTFEAFTTAQDGTTDPTPASRSFTLSSSVQEGTETAHGSDHMISTDSEGDGVHPNDPVETEVDTYLGGGDIVIREGTVTSGAPMGWTYYGQQVEITAPTEDAQHPLWIQFALDFSVWPEGLNADHALFRNGVRVPRCNDDPGIASPDPCLDIYGIGPNDYWVNTTQGGTWNFGYLAPAGEPSPSPSPTPSPSPSTPSPRPSPSPTGEVKPVVKVASEVTVRFDLRSRSFIGTVRTDRDGCRTRREIKIFRIQEGSDRLMGSDVTSSFGRWVVAPDRVRAGRYYARAVRSSIVKRDVKLVCLAARTGTIMVTS